MKILIVTDNFPPKKFGGMAQHAWHISHFLAQKHKVCVLLPRNHTEVQKDLPFGVFPRLTMKFPRVDAARSLSVAKAFEPDVIHVCTAGLAFPSICRSYPVVLRVVGNDFLRPWCGGSLLLRSLYFRLPSARLRAFFQNKETTLRKRKVNLQLQKCVKIVANSDWTKERLTEEGISLEKIETVVGGMETDLFVPAHKKSEVRKELGLSPESIVLVTAANLVGKKGFDTVIRTVAQLKNRYPNIEYIIVGDGEEEFALRTLADSLNVADRVHMVGRQTQKELSKYYQAADLYIQISRDHRLASSFIDVETMGRTYFEAGGCGIPVVAANVGGVPSVVEHGKNGLLVDDPENVDEVVEKVTTLLDNPELRERMGSEGIRLATEKFSWKMVGAKFEELLTRAAGQT